MPVYWGARMLSQDWVRPGHGLHEIYPARWSSDAKTPEASEAVTAYAVRRPDQTWAVMLVNRDSKHAARVRLVLNGDHALFGPRRRVKVVQFSSRNYVWDAATQKPTRDKPSDRYDRRGGTVTLPPLSLTVVR
jgi:hypothetical protein